MTINEMKQKKLELGYSYQQIAQLSGLPLGTVHKVFSGETKYPRYATLQALNKVFTPAGGYMAGSPEPADSLLREGGGHYIYGSSATKEEDENIQSPDSISAKGDTGHCQQKDNTPAVAEPLILHPFPSDTSYEGKHTGVKSVLSGQQMDETAGNQMEPSSGQPLNKTPEQYMPEAAFLNHDDYVRRTCMYYGANPDLIYHGRKQGEFTLEDYYSYPEERRIELIDGIIYDMTAPRRAHQRVLSKLDHYFESFIEEHGGPCEVTPAPDDVWLDQDNKTTVQPDLAVLCRPESQDAQRIIGAPDYVAEILSPSTRHKDMSLKLEKYLHAGVREYWIVDLQHLQVIVYDNTREDDLQIRTYGFEDTIPVAIYNGQMKIDFSRIYKVIRGMPGVGPAERTVLSQKCP